MSGELTAPDGMRYSHMRDFVSRLPYDQRNIGIQLVRDALKDTHAPQDVRDVVEKELKELDRPELRDFCRPLQQKPGTDPSQLQPFIDQHNGSYDNRLPPVRGVQPWDGKGRDGTFLDIGNGQVVQHQGKGNYALMDVQRDLGDVPPLIGYYAALAAMGQPQSFK